MRQKEEGGRGGGENEGKEGCSKKGREGEGEGRRKMRK